MSPASSTPTSPRTSVRISVSSGTHAGRMIFCRRQPFGCGAIAQLGERLHGMQEVSGSIPLGSTTTPKKPAFPPFLIKSGAILFQKIRKSR